MLKILSTIIFQYVYIGGFLVRNKFQVRNQTDLIIFMSLFDIICFTLDHS